MKTLHCFCICVICVFLAFCNKKDKTPEPQQEPPVEDLAVSFRKKEFICYPKDSTIIQIEMQVTNSSKDITWNWNSPSGLTGPGPFTLSLGNQMSFDVTAVESGGRTKKFQTTIRNSEVDVALNDYRNQYQGSYDCSVYAIEYRNGPFAPPTTSSYNGQIQVAKHADFDKIIVSKITLNEPYIKYVGTPTHFYGYATSCDFAAPDKISVHNWSKTSGDYYYTGTKSK